MGSSHMSVFVGSSHRRTVFMGSSNRRIMFVRGSHRTVFVRSSHRKTLFVGSSINGQCLWVRLVPWCDPPARNCRHNVQVTRIKIWNRFTWAWVCFAQHAET